MVAREELGCAHKKSCRSAVAVNSANEAISGSHLNHRSGSDAWRQTHGASSPPASWDYLFVKCWRRRRAANANPAAPKVANNHVDGSGVGIEFCTLISPAEGILRRQ